MGARARRRPGALRRGQPSLSGDETQRSRLTALARGTSAEAWFERADGATLCVLLSDERAFVMLLEEEGDPGMHARDDEAEGAPVRFTLANGQVDAHPASETIGRDEALAIAEAFLASAPLPTRTRWRSDR